MGIKKHYDYYTEGLMDKVDRQHTRTDEQCEKRVEFLRMRKKC